MQTPATRRRNGVPVRRRQLQLLPLMRPDRTTLGSFSATGRREHQAYCRAETSRRAEKRRCRAGLTLIELLVVISIIGMLMAVLLPAVMQSRAAARRVQCANNLRNLGLAMLSEAGAKGRFPAAGYFGTDGTRYHGWVVPLLPYLERRDLYARWDFEQPSTGTANQAIGQIRLEILVCPDDDSSHSSEPDLSYVVNCGIGFTMPVDTPSVYRSPGSPFPGAEPIDLNGNGIVAVTPGAPDGRPTDRDLFGAMGLFFVENWPHGAGSPPRRRSLDSIPDGSSQTIMFAENTRAGAFDQAPGANWATPEPYRNAFFLSGYICDNASCAPGAVHYERANQAGGGPWSFEAINAGLSQPEGKAPWPSSGHLGGVQVLFADGHLTFMSEDIEGAIYASLTSPDARRLEGTTLEQVIADESQY